MMHAAVILSLLPTAAAVAARPANAVSSARRLSLNKHAKVAPVFDLDSCILEAKSEDEVGYCMALADEFEVPAYQSADNDLEEANPLELCVLEAKSEDEVQACMQAHTEAEARAALAEKVLECQSAEEIQAALAGKEAPVAVVHDPVEECILNAASEDEVQECLQMDDKADDTPMDELDLCILAARSEDGVQSCLQEHEAREAAFDTLRSTLATCIGDAADDDEMEACIIDAGIPTA